MGSKLSGDNKLFIFYMRVDVEGDIEKPSPNDHRPSRLRLLTRLENVTRTQDLNLYNGQ
jgi:hypothetical protein